MSKVHVLKHPLVQDKLARLRDRKTSPKEFRELMEEITMLMGYEVLSGAKLKSISVQTPLKKARAQTLAQPLIVVGILRAGLGMMAGFARLAPGAQFGHIGIYRNEATLEPVQYYVRLPDSLSQAYVVLVDPMLATGGSSIEALDILKSYKAKNIRLLCLISAQNGVREVQRHHPDVPIYTACVDSVLNSQGYIVPGLGDAGDRLFGT